MTWYEIDRGEYETSSVLQHLYPADEARCTGCGILIGVWLHEDDDRPSTSGPRWTPIWVHYGLGPLCEDCKDQHQATTVYSPVVALRGYTRDGDTLDFYTTGRPTEPYTRKWTCHVGRVMTLDRIDATHANGAVLTVHWGDLYLTPGSDPVLTVADWFRTFPA